MATTSIDQLLDLLIDALEERRVTRENGAEKSAELPPIPSHNAVADLAPEPPALFAERSPADLAATDSLLQAEPVKRAPALVEEAMPLQVQPESAETFTIPADEVEHKDTITESVEHIPMIDNMPRTMVRLFIALVAFVAIANLQLFDITSLNTLFASGNGGTTTVRFARDGMLLQGDGLKVYLMENNQRRWITTSEAFNAFGYRWGAVRHVNDSYLEQFVEGEPIYLALKCPDSPHVFALDVVGSTRRVRRWISDIDTFRAMGFVWEEIDENRCNFLRGLPNGDPFPADTERQIPNP